MARIAGVNIPTAKRVEIGLQYIHGIGAAKAKEICGKVGIELARRVNTLSDDEVIRVITSMFIPVAVNLYKVREDRGAGGDLLRKPVRRLGRGLRLLLARNPLDPARVRRLAGELPHAGGRIL